MRVDIAFTSSRYQITIAATVRRSACTLLQEMHAKPEEGRGGSDWEAQKGSTDAADLIASSIISSFSDPPETQLRGEHSCTFLQPTSPQIQSFVSCLEHFHSKKAIAEICSR